MLRLLEPPHFHLAIDDFNRMRAAERTRASQKAELDDTLRKTRAGFHRAAVGMAAAGNNIVPDHVFSEPWRLHDCPELMVRYEVTFVGIFCSLAELERRELSRGNRVPGLAAGQLATVHAHDLYDVECDNTRNSARDCAQRIADFVSSGIRPTAFVRLRSALPAR